MADFFISYSHSDRAFLDDLVIQIRNVFAEKSLWFDDAIPGGAEWWTLILTEIDKCDIFIFLLSDTAVKSQYCQDELRNAINSKKRVLPILVGKFQSGYPGDITDDLSKFLKDRQYVDLSSEMGMRDSNAASKLWGALRFLLENPDVAEIPTELENFDPSENSSEETKTKLTRAERWLLSNHWC